MLVNIYIVHALYLFFVCIYKAIRISQVYLFFAVCRADTSTFIIFTSIIKERDMAIRQEYF